METPCYLFIKIITKTEKEINLFTMNILFFYIYQKL